MSVATSTALGIAGLGVSAAGAGASASGGKKARGDASNAAQQQLQLQQQQLAQSQKLIDTGLSAFNPAKDYWTSLLQGGQAAQVAVAPIAEQVQATSEAGQRNILNSLPAGGERNLALAQAKIQQGSDISRLYAGVQPTAASNLGQLAGSITGQGVNLGSTAAPSTGSALNYFSQNASNQTAAANEAASGFGSALNRYLYQKGQKGGTNTGGQSAGGVFP